MFWSILSWTGLPQLGPVPLCDRVHLCFGLLTAMEKLIAGFQAGSCFGRGEEV